MMHGFGMGGYGLFGIINLVFTLAVLAGFALLAVWAVRRFTSGGGTTGSAGRSSADLTPREIVQQRYARGEITREQYKSMLDDLS
jgi:putative membrane protein